MADNDDINKSSNKSINAVGREIKELEKGLKFVPAGEVSILEKIRIKNKEADRLNEQINTLKAQMRSAELRVASSQAELSALNARYQATQDQQIRRSIAGEIRGISDEVAASKIASQTFEKELEPLQGQYNKLQKFINEKATAVEVKSAAREEAKTRQFQGQMSRLFSESSFRGASIEERRTPSALYGANKLVAQGLSYEDLMKKRGRIEERVSKMGLEAAELGGDIFDLENRPTGKGQKLEKLYEVYQNLTKYAASLDLAISERTAAGEDPFSKEARIGKTAAFVKEKSEEKRLENEILSGKVAIGSFSSQGQVIKKDVGVAEIGSKLNEEMGNFAKIFAERSKALAEGEDNLEEFNKKLELGAENIGKLSKAASAEPGISKRDRTISNLIQSGYAIQAASGAIQEISVGQTNIITNTKIQSAQQANDLFFRRQAAISGDMTQLTALTGGSPQLAEIEAGRNEFLTNVAGTISAAGSVATAGGAIIAAGTTGRVGGILGGGSRVGGILGGGSRVGSTAAAVNATSSAVSSVTGLLRNVNGNAEGRAEYARRMQLSDEEIKIKGFQRQQFYNYSMGITDAALAGGGAAGQQFFEQMLGGENEYGPVRSSDQMLERMRAAGIGTEQMAQMAQMGLAQQGSMFNANQIFSAKELQNKGYGTIESNMRMYGQLAGAGANNPSASFEKVLEVAVAKGFDSSKATSMLVENTAAMSQRSMGAAIGVDVTRGALATIAGIAANKEDQPNREFALSRAATAAQAYEAISSNTGISMTTMATMSQIQRAGGVGAETAKLLQGTDLATLRDFQSKAKKYEKMTPNERTTFESELQKAGMYEFIDRKTGAVRAEQLQAAITTKTQGNLANLLAMSGMFNLNDPQEAAMFKQFMGGKGEELKRTKQGTEFLNKMNLAVPLITGRALTGEEASRGGITEEISTEEARKKIEEGGGLSFKKMMGLKEAAGREQATQAQLGAQEMGGITEAINKIAEATQVISKMGMDGKAGNFGELASKAASEFNSGAEFFKTGMVYFDKALDKIAIKTDIPRPERPLNRKL